MVSDLNPPQSPLVRGEDDQNAELASSPDKGQMSENYSRDAWQSAEVTPSPDKSQMSESSSCDVQQSAELAPSPDKGRDGEGLNYIPYKTCNTRYARQNRKNPTPAETLLWNKILRNKQLAGYKFTRQKPLGNYVVDFYCTELQLVIEVDGDSHAEQVFYDQQRTEWLASQNIRVMRFTNRDVLQNLEGVYHVLFTNLKSVRGE